MRGRGGLGNVHHMMKMNEEVKKMSQKVEEKNMEELKKQMSSFSHNLNEFGAKYKNEIKLNPELRKEFYLMCTQMGVDPLASKSLWNTTLNLSEFYYELAIQIITISLALREKIGALIEISDLKSYLSKMRKKEDISEHDIEKAIESASELKCGFQIINLSNRKKAVMTIPISISNETNQILEIATENKGWISFKAFRNVYQSLSFESFDAAMSDLVKKGVVWVDDIVSAISPNSDKYFGNDTVRVYWFPGLMSA